MPGDHDDKGNDPCSRPDQTEQTIKEALDATVECLCTRLDQMEATLLREFRLLAERVIVESPEGDQ